MITVPERPEEAEPADWHPLYWRAWAALRYDRPYGAMGGEGPVPYAAISGYAKDHGIAGNDFRTFHILFAAIDAEWLDYVAEIQNEKEGKA